MDTVCEATMAIAVARVGGIGMIHRFLPVHSQADMVAQVKAQGLLVGAAVGTSEDSMQRAKALVNAGADALVLDIAHGHAEHAIAELAALKREYGADVDLIAGNVATRLGAVDLIEAGADAIKVGVGPGGVCTTRLVAGVGVPAAHRHQRLRRARGSPSSPTAASAVPGTSPRRWPQGRRR